MTDDKCWLLSRGAVSLTMTENRMKALFHLKPRQILTYRPWFILAVATLVIALAFGLRYRQVAALPSENPLPPVHDTTTTEPVTEPVPGNNSTTTQQQHNKQHNNVLTSSEESVPMEETWISLGEYELTAYCSCKTCCGKWALNRPTDENGEPIVYTASGARAVAGTTIAVDPNVIPFGTTVKINDHMYIAQDSGSAIKGNRIDVYFDDHQEALNFGRQTAEVFMMEVTE